MYILIAERSPTSKHFERSSSQRYSCYNRADPQIIPPISIHGFKNPERRDLVHVIKIIMCGVIHPINMKKPVLCSLVRNLPTGRGDQEAKAYYWHRFYYYQPELNYENPEVQLEMIKAADFWLKMGVDGFRLPSMAFLFEEEGTSSENLPQTHEFLQTASLTY